MRFNSDSISPDDDSPQPGALLIAHPSMLDPNFRRTVVFLAVNDAGEGSVGLIMNRPLNKTLGEFDSPLSSSSLANIQLYEGGPVAPDKLILAAWRWDEKEGTFQLYFGIDRDKAEQLLHGEKVFHVRGFMGHSGWSDGQLSVEMDQGAWLLSRCLPELIKCEGEEVWRLILRQEHPRLCLQLDAPEDPSLN